MIGPGGGRDLVSALVFGAGHVDGVEINPIIANDVMRDRFREFSGGIYTHPRVRIAVDDGRSFVRRAPDQYDVIQASLVDTWAATAAGAYTLTENSLYTVEAFNDYLDHLTDGGILTITRWVFDGLRLVSLAQEACEARGCSAADQLAIVRQKDVATFLFKKTPFTAGRSPSFGRSPRELEFDVLYAPGVRGRRSGSSEHELVADTRLGDYGRLIRAPDRHAFYARLPAGHHADDRRPAVLLPHHEAREPVSDRLRAVDAVRQRAERAAHADGDFRRARRAVRLRAARSPAAASRGASRDGGWPGSRSSARSAPASC